MRTATDRALFFLAGTLAAVAVVRWPIVGRALAAAEPTPTPTASPAPAPGIWDRALSSLSDTASKYTSDEAVADYVVASVQKQERVNKILAQRGSRYRISELHVDIGVAPALEVAITESAPPPGTTAPTDR